MQPFLRFCMILTKTLLNISLLNSKICEGFNADENSEHIVLGMNTYLNLVNIDKDKCNTLELFDVKK